MERFCIVTNYEKDDDYQITKLISDYLDKKGKTCFFASKETNHSFSNKKCYHINDIPDTTECAIVLGGDGTIIQTADALAKKNVPLLGINLGTLGFLAEIEKHNIMEALNELMLNEYTIETRMMLNGQIIRQNHSGEKRISLNDIVITRSGFSRLISLKIFVNDEQVNTYIGDGVIIATSTGSTGYNLSAGGPVLTPTSCGMIITPICPHTLNARSIVVSPEDKIIIEVGKSKKTQPEEALATFDGTLGEKLQEKDIIEIEKAEVTTKLIKMKNTSFFEILRTKLGEGKL